MYFVAELGSVHRGIQPLAYEMVRRAKLAGADAVKFQFGWPEEGGPMRTWATENAQTLRMWCDGIKLMVSLFSRKGLDVALRAGVDYLKLPHPYTFKKNGGEDYDALLAACLMSGKPVFCSGEKMPGTRALYCIPKYPVYPNELRLPETFGGWYGYSSHCHGIADALVAIARGAMLVEKHVTLDKTDTSIKDNHFALTFEEFGEMVRIGRQIAEVA